MCAYVSVFECVYVSVFVCTFVHVYLLENVIYNYVCV